MAAAGAGAGDGRNIARAVGGSEDQGLRRGHVIPFALRLLPRFRITPTCFCTFKDHPTAQYIIPSFIVK